jgi:hypothetical protein
MRVAGVAITAVLAAAVWAFPVTALAAGSYQVSACNFAPEGTNNSWVWSNTDTAQPSHYAEHASCPYQPGASGGKADQEGGLSTTDALGLANGAEPGTSAGWSFSAPAGTTITGITYERYIGHSLDPDNYWSPALRADGTILPGETCLDTVENGENCSVGAPGTVDGPATITGLAAHELSLGIRCQAPTGQECITGATQHAVWAAMYGATVTLSDTTPPTLSAPTGALWGPGEAGGFHKGPESIKVSAQDVGGGVATILLSADGHPVASYAAACNFTLAQPCPSSTGPQTLSLPTTQLSDGKHTLELAAIDAAGNPSSTATTQITVENTPPPPPLALAATPTQAGGSTFTLTWSDPPGQIAPITGALYEVCPARGQGTCTAPSSAPPAGPANLTLPGPGEWSIALWLTNAAGNTNRANAAYATVAVPTTIPTAHESKPSKTPVPPRIYLTATVRGQVLAVHVTGPPNGKVRVNVTGTIGRNTILFARKTAALNHGRLSVTFRLGRRTAAHALLRVRASLNGTMVARTLRPNRHSSTP